MKIALFHDFLVRMGGAEHVLRIFQDMFPDAEIHTLMQDKKAVRRLFGETTIHTLPEAQKRYDLLSVFPQLKRYSTKLFIGKFPQYIDRVDLSTYDLVITSSGAWSHGLITSINTKFVVYMHSPMRFAWDSFNSYKRDLGVKHHTSLRNILLTRMLGKARMWDQLASKRDNLLLCNSRTVQKRIEKFYRRNDSIVLYPPVNIESIPDPSHKREVGDYFLVISTFAKYKHIDVIIRALQERGQKLVLIGDGPEEDYLRSIANKEVTFAGKVSESEKVTYITNARALVQVSEEDFGIVPVEAMAAGVPVIGFGEGGIKETIEHEKTGILFEEQTTESLGRALDHFFLWEKEYDPMYARKKAEQYSTDTFKRQFLAILKDHDYL